MAKNYIFSFCDLKKAFACIAEDAKKRQKNEFGNQEKKLDTTRGSPGKTSTSALYYS